VDALGVGWVFFLLDDVVLGPGFDAARLFRIAAKNALTVASPAIRRAHGHKFPGMRPNASLPAGAVGRRVDRIELFCAAFTPAAYRCFHDLIDAPLNSIGYGYPDWLPAFCGARGYAAGVVDAVVASHGVPGERTAWTKSYSEADAKAARARMERHYAAKGVDLLGGRRVVHGGFLYE